MIIGSQKTRTNIIFDFGGVLLDWNPHYLYDKLLNGDRGAVDRFLTEVDFFNWNTLQDKGRPFSTAIAELTERFPQYADLIRAYDDQWEESLNGPIEGTVDILHLLKEDGYPLFALSNWSTEKFPKVRGRYAFMKWFQKIVLSGDARLVKPDERIFALFLEQTGLRAEDCLFIDDSPANTAVAERMGFRVIRFTSPEELEAELRRQGILNGAKHGA